MAALLHVERDNTEKVAYYITEARRMGIEVLSPDVNASKLDFTVEQLPADAPPPARSRFRASATAFRCRRAQRSATDLWR